MPLLQSDYLKLKILKKLHESNTQVSYNSLRKKVGAVNYNSIKRNCEFLELVGFIEIERKTVEHRRYNFVKITKKGEGVLYNIKKGGYDENFD